jgi:hypothetical protein
MVQPKVRPGIHYYAVVSHADKTKTLFVIASVFRPGVSWRLYEANLTDPDWVEDLYLSNYFGPVDGWRLRLLTHSEARALLEIWGGGLLLEQQRAGVPASQLSVD